jgi:hypothetical protein
MTPSDLAEIPSWEWPPNAGETLKEALRQTGTDPEDRAQAANLGGDLVVMDDEMADLLLAILINPDEPEDVRANAAIALGPALEEADTQGYDEDDDDFVPSISEEKFVQIRATLQDLYADQNLPKQVRRRILEASVRATEDWHDEAVKAAAASDDEEWKLTATFAMRFVPGFEDEILEMLESSNPEIYYEAIQAAGNREVEGAWPHIFRVLTSQTKDKALLLAAIEAAPWVNREEAQGLLVVLLDHKDEDIAGAASEALAMAELDHSQFDSEADYDGDYQDEDDSEPGNEDAGETGDSGPKR